MRVALGISYDGSVYHGWQRQIGLNTVQEQVERVLSRIANHEVNLFCAGRTDTSVHALQQIVHFDTHSEREERAWMHGGNTYLPADIRILWAKKVPEHFHARHKVLNRSYHYWICNASIRPALFYRHMTWQYQSLDEVAMGEAASYLLGTHDFSAYRAVGCQANSPIRTIEEFTVKRVSDYIGIHVKANGFLYHMVRNMVGVLISIGISKQKPIWAQEVLESRDRRLGGATAPPYGLYFNGATYADEFQLPQIRTSLFFQELTRIL